MNKLPLTLYLAAPRGFCAGVDRAIKIVELALEKWGAPVFVRHEIVHNKFVVDGLRALGAVFVEDLDDVPLNRPVIFSAHGVPKAVPAAALARTAAARARPCVATACRSQDCGAANTSNTPQRQAAHNPAPSQHTPIIRMPTD